MSAGVLVLCRTPLQARIVLKIATLERLDRPDVLYFSQDDSETDRVYFERLRQVAGEAQYLHVRRQRADILNHLIAMSRCAAPFRRKRYQRVFVASIGSPLFRWILRRQSRATLVTFDDGAANILPQARVHGEDTGRMRMYARALRLPSPAALLARSSVHYTLYGGFDNIVPKAKLRTIEVFSETPPSGSTGPSYFIGQPIQELLPPAAISVVREFLRSQRIDYYVCHPREETPLIEGVDLLDKQGDVAEVAILRSSAGHKPRVLSLFSTVLFNLSSDVADKVYISVSGTPGEQTRLELVHRAGCEILTIHDQR